MKNTKETIVMTLCFSMIFSPSAVFAAPQGGKVVGGSANIQQSGATTTINQNSDRAIINWHSFDIGKNEAVRHNMPSRNSAGLHRVVGGGGASQIQGILQSNGNVYLVNPAGVVIHKGARVDTNGFIATTRDISDSNFMNGKMVFDRPGRPDAQIINQGSISVRESGLAALVAPTVRNEGLIAGKLGKVALASGDSTWKLDMHGDDLITFTVDENDVNALHATDGTPLVGVENSGSIKTEGGVVVLTAAQLDGIVGSVVNSGEVSAASAELKGGKITFRGQGSDVDIVNTGTVDASSAVADGGMVRMDTDGKTRSSGTIAATGGQKGGKMTLTGREVALASTSKIDVSGNTGGGTALVGGNALGKGPERNAKTARVESGAAIHADAKVKGDGGQVVIWSDEKTSFDGTITARGGSEGGNGGQVETSGNSLKLGDAARVNTLALRGEAGQWLLDPVDFTIAVSGGDMTGATVSANLEMGDVIIRSEDGQGGGNGNINVNDKIEWFSNFGLTLDAANFVNVNNNIILHGDYSSLNIITLPSGHIYIDTGSYNINKGKVSFLGKYNKYFINGNDYKLIKTIEELQNLDVNHDFYALARDIDASSTKIWNGGSGFVPLEGVTGALNGGNHVIKGLYINSPDKNSVGLVGWTRFFMVDNLGLLDVNITGHSDVGGLIGTAYGSDVRIRNVGVTGHVSGVGNIGGVLGKYSPLSGEIYRSYSTANVSGHSNVGGFAGYLNRGVWGSYSSGDVSGQTNIGGFVGYADGGGYVLSYSTGNILGNPSIAGGFVGYAENSRFQDCYSTGTIIPPVGAQWNHPFLGDGEHCSAYNCYIDYETSHANTDPLAGRFPGEGVYGASTADLKSGNMLSGNPWIVDGINYPKLDMYTFTSNEDNSSSLGTTPNPDGTPTPTPIEPSESEKNIIHSHYQDQSKNRVQESEKQKELEKFVEDFCKRVNDDYLGLVFSEEGTASSLSILINSYVEINFKYILIEAIKKGVDVGTLVASGNWTGLLQSLLTDVSLAERIIRVILANNFLNGAKECYQMALNLYNQPGKKDKQKIIQIVEYLKNATELGFMGMIFSEDIYNDMKNRVEFQSQYPILAFLSNIGEVSSEAASSLSDALFGTMLGTNTAIKGTVANALDIYKTGQYRIDAIRNAVKISKIQNITNIIHGGNDVIEFIDGVTGIYEMLTYSQKNKYIELSNQSVQHYNKIIDMLNSLPDMSITHVPEI